MEIDTEPNADINPIQNPKKTRCPTGMRKDRKTGLCIPMTEELIQHKKTLRNKAKSNKVSLKKNSREEELDVIPVIEPSVLEEESSPPSSPSVEQPIVKRCPTGFRKDPKTKKCVPMSEKLIQHKKTLRNKRKLTVVPVDEEPAVVDTQPAVVDTQTAVEEEPAVVEEPTDDQPEEEPVVVDTQPVEEPTEIVEEPTEIVEEEAPKLLKRQTKQNEFLLKKEKMEHDALLSAAPETDTFLYPTLDDPDFNYKISQRQEFADTTYNGEIMDIRKQANILCNLPFELKPNQLFVRNFLSFQTPYNSLLLYNGLGSGKTCSAIGIAEEMRTYMKQIGFNKKIIIVASPNVQDNFRLQLFDERKLELLPNGQWNLNTCVGNALLNEINPTKLRGLTKERVSFQIRTIINTYYVFMGDKGEFGNYINKKIYVPDTYTPAEKAALRTKKIKQYFSNRLIIIDEIHNLRISEANKNKMTSTLLMEIAKKSNNMRLLLLSATPMYNSYSEIIWLTNLLNVNDKRGEIDITDVFNSDGTFREPDNERPKRSIRSESGRELLKRKLTGYISYVRGENPYEFPYRIYPETFEPDRTLSSITYPTKQLNQMLISDEDAIQHIPIYTSQIAEYQKKGYHYILSYLELKQMNMTDKWGKTKIMPTFENMESVGYNLILLPLESLIIVYPHPILDVYDENVVVEKSDAEKKEMIQSFVGKTGLSNVMNYKTVKTPIPYKYDFEYKASVLKKYGKIFSSEEIYKYSAKISNICNIIQKPSTGIILIYSQYIDGGIIPMALALESIGFSRYASTSEHNRNLFKKSEGVEPVDALTMRPLSESSSGSSSNGGMPARYVIITGDKDYSQNNNEDIKYITRKENMNGEYVKVVLISKAAAEGLDFKNIRQVHVLDPWYNMNRIEQIIGRAVRNMSHCQLPFEERNTEIYLHGLLLDNDEESADLYVYRTAEKKAIQIGRVTRLMKEIAVDCQLNIAQTNFTQEKLFENLENQNIDVHLSSFPPDKTVRIKIGDKPYTDICDYMDNCSFQCATRENRPEIPLISNTYEEPFVKNISVVIMKKIRDLFRERISYKREHLIQSINYLKKYPIQQIFYALMRFVNNKTEEIIDKYDRSGYLITKGDYYVFQPHEITDEHASIFERQLPVDFKHTSLKMELPKALPSSTTLVEFQPDDIAASDSIALIDTDEIPGTKKPRGSDADTQRVYTTLMNQLKANMEWVSEKNLTISTADTNWYKRVNPMVAELMNIHRVPADLINKYIVFHFLDTLKMSEKLALATVVYGVADASAEADGYRVLLQMYLDDLSLMVDDNGKSVRGIVLSDHENGKNQLYVLEETAELQWRKAEYSDEVLFKEARINKITIPIERINRTYIGFMHPFKNKEVVFKTKNMSELRNNKGAKCENADKSEIIEKIRSVSNEPELYKNTTIERPNLCALLEILMRWITDKNNESVDIADNEKRVLFFGPEMTLEMNIVNTRIV
jgi:hypothetical protein